MLVETCHWSPGTTINWEHQIHLSGDKGEQWSSQFGWDMWSVLVPQPFLPLWPEVPLIINIYSSLSRIWVDTDPKHWTETPPTPGFDNCSNPYYEFKAIHLKPYLWPLGIGTYNFRSVYISVVVLILETKTSQNNFLCLLSGLEFARRAVDQSNSSCWSSYFLRKLR